MDAFSMLVLSLSMEIVATMLIMVCTPGAISQEFAIPYSTDYARFILLYKSELTPENPLLCLLNLLIQYKNRFASLPFACVFTRNTSPLLG